MSDVSEDFWPRDLPDPADPAPVAFLKIQAALLGRHTRGDIEGIVRTSTEEGTADYSLHLKADALGDYLYKILWIAHPAIGQLSDYPITAQNSAGGDRVIISDDTEFRDWLRHPLSSDYVRSAITNLIRYIAERRMTTVG